MVELERLDAGKSIRLTNKNKQRRRQANLEQIWDQMDALANPSEDEILVFLRKLGVNSVGGVIQVWFFQLKISLGCVNYGYEESLK